jgi:carbon monoxide dehydrogenase subunit G
VAIRIRERFQVAAPASAVWAFLIDPRRVVDCVPGGELLAVVDARTFDGCVRVAIGPFVFAYGGRIRIEEEDEVAWRVRLVGEAHERAGAETARLTLDSRLRPLPGGGTAVVALGRVDVAGRLLSLGRPVLEPLAHQVFRDFTRAVVTAIEAGATGRDVPAGAAPDARPARRGAPARPPLRPLPVALRAIGAWLAAWLGRR